MNKLIFPAVLLLTTALCLHAQEENREADSLRHAFGRQQVAPTNTISTPYADTLDTGNPGVKVVLYDNGTYRFVRDLSQMAADSVFTEFWDTKNVNPYRNDPDPLPEQFSLWIVDSLGAYCCPNQTKPRSLFGYRHGRRHGRAR